MPYPIRRRGQRIIIPAPMLKQAVVLPPRCVRCGAAADGKAVEREFSWHHPAFYLLILPGILIYAIVAMIVRNTMRVRVPFCAHHARRRSIAVTLAWVLPLVGISDAFVLPRFNLEDGWVAVIAGGFFLSGILIWAVVSNPIKPRFIDESRGEFSGFCEAYLQQFAQTEM
jgi:cell division protein FtsX